MAPSMNRWIGTVAIVTGASSGIGASVASALVKHGLLVAGLARRVERLEELTHSLQQEKGKLFPYKCDITNDEQVTKTFEHINDNVGQIHILINNAGLLQPTDLIDGDFEKWKITVDTNILGICSATREAIKYIRSNDVEGCIININSILGHRVLDMPGLNVYPATKHGVTALSETLRREISRKGLPIRVTSVSPGYVHTELAEIGFGTKVDLLGLDAEDVADAIVFAISMPQHVNIKEVELEVYGSTLK